MKPVSIDLNYFHQYSIRQLVKESNSTANHCFFKEMQLHKHDFIVDFQFYFSFDISFSVG